ncbi:MAG: helix-turn-helix domain-containing protein [Thermodesulfovibrionales bacterium]
MKELKRSNVIRKVMEGVLMQKEAAEMLSVSERQIRRIVRRIEAQGDKGIVHGLGGRIPIGKRWSRWCRGLCSCIARNGFGPLMAEKLREGEGTEVSKESVRTWLMDAGLWQKPQAEGSPKAAAAQGMFWGDAADGRKPSPVFED